MRFGGYAQDLSVTATGQRKRGITPVTIGSLHQPVVRHCKQVRRTAHAQPEYIVALHEDIAASLGRDAVDALVIGAEIDIARSDDLQAVYNR